MKRALLLFGHPDQDTFNHRLAAGYASGFRAGGGGVERIDLASLSFDPILHHGYRVPQPLEPDLVRAREAIEAADHLVWVFPTYWASPPALVRGFVDRLFLPGWAFSFGPESSLPKGLLAGRSARVITTMDTPGWWYTAVSHRCLHRSFGSATLAFCGLSPVAFTAFHGVRDLGEAGRARAASRAQQLGRRDARASGRRLLPKLSSAAA
ncbi:MAG: NAD(P)H-dependent oxidoreductase [Myxococcales bacterium]|nr:NAD(P)H-dependent oxidoreductase [Myxococcales bacterium]